MHLNSNGEFVRTDIWREGKWLDTWSIVHLLSGITIGFFPKYLGLDTFSAYVIVLLLLVSYEMFEALVKIEETPQNRFMDVVVGMASFIPVYHLHPLLSDIASITLFSVFFISASVLGAIGWHVSRKAAVVEAKLRAEIAHGREKFKEERGKITQRFRAGRERRRLKRMKRRALRGDVPQ